MMLLVLGAVIIGLTLGMLGSGGSAITVPILVYLVGHGAKESIAESMAIVGVISAVAAIPYARAKQVDWRSVICFGLPAMLGTFIGAWLGGAAAASLQLVVFGVVLLVAAAVMLRKAKAESAAETTEPLRRAPVGKAVVEGMLVGTLTGFVGVGGGFLIVPALVVLGGLPMRLAIGTSLTIIAIKSAVGFLKYEHYLLTHGSSVDVATILVVVLIGIVGSLIGRSINQRLDQRALKQVFAVFLVLIGAFIVIHEGSKMFGRSVERIEAAARFKIVTSNPQGVFRCD
jgi:uncharacterized membrane protein YfcA